MKKLALLILSAATVFVAAQSLTYNYSRTLTATEARGIVRAVDKYNTAQSAADTNHVNVTPKQYMDARINEIFDSYNRQADAEDLETSVRDLWMQANAAKRAAAVQALQ